MKDQNSGLNNIIDNNDDPEQSHLFTPIVALTANDLPSLYSRIMITFGLDLKIIELNPVAEKILRIKRESALGQDVRQIFESAGFNSVGLMRMIVGIKSSDAISQSIEFLHSKDHKIAMEATLHLVKAEGNRPLCVFFHASPTMNLITQHKDHQLVTQFVPDSITLNENAVLSYLFQASSQMNSISDINEMLLATCKAITNTVAFSKPIIFLLGFEYKISKIIFNQNEFPNSNLAELEGQLIRGVPFPMPILDEKYRLGKTYIIIQDDWRKLIKKDENKLTLSKLPFQNDVLIYPLRNKAGMMYAILTTEYSAKEKKVLTGLLQALDIFLGNLSVIMEQRHLEQKITQMNQDLVDKNKQLAQVDKLKADFLANITHEVRTPLAVGMGYLELLTKEKFSSLNDQEKEAVSYVISSLTTLNDILSNLITFNELNQGDQALYRQDLVINDLLSSVVYQINRKMKNADSQIELNLPETAYLVNADIKKIEIVLKILIDNAFKFSDNKPIKIDIQPEEKSIVVSVKDQGIGMSKETVSVIFQNFRQADGSVTRKFGGIGLGLSMAKLVMDLHGERIWAESKENEGSTFFFSLTRIKQNMDSVETDTQN